jgi:hypothetical protein
MAGYFNMPGWTWMECGEKHCPAFGVFKENYPTMFLYHCKNIVSCTKCGYDFCSMHISKICLSTGKCVYCLGAKNSTRKNGLSIRLMNLSAL